MRTDESASRAAASATAIRPIAASGFILRKTHVSSRRFYFAPGRLNTASSIGVLNSTLLSAIVTTWPAPVTVTANAVFTPSTRR